MLRGNSGFRRKTGIGAKRQAPNNCFRASSGGGGPFREGATILTSLTILPMSKCLFGVKKSDVDTGRVSAS